MLNFATLFDRIGKFAYAGSIIVTALGTTIEDEVEDAVQNLGGANTIEYETARQGVLAGLRGLQASCSGALSSCVVTPCQNLLIQTVKDDNQQPTDSLQDALAELLTQMIANAASLDASTVAIATSYGAANEGNGVIVTTIKRADGRVNEHAFDEDITVLCTTGPATGLASFALKGELSVGILEYNWPLGSGANQTLTSNTADSSSNLVSNGGFEEEDENQSHLPEGWTASVATLGTTLKMTLVEQQTIAITGTPSAGTYTVHFTDRDGIVRSTAPLIYNATGAAVLIALRAVTGLGSVTLTTTGTTPNYTHTVVFVDVPNPAQLTSTNNTTGGTVTHATTVASSANVMRGARAIEFDSNAAELTTLNVPMVLAAQTRYAINLYALADVVPAAGVITVDLVDGIGGTLVMDDQRMRNSMRITCSALTTGFQSLAALTAATNEVQTLSSTATGGTFKLIFDGQTTANIAFGASAATVKTELEALSNITVDEVSCGGGVLPATPITITFLGKWAAQDVPLITVDNTLATGGTASVAETTKGNPGEAVFRTPTNMPKSVYLRVRISTAISAGTSVFVDELCMVAMAALYTGGPAVAAFTGRNFWGVNDTGLLVVTNDAAGLANIWLNRIFALRDSDLLLPTNRTGAETINDSLFGP